MPGGPELRVVLFVAVIGCATPPRPGEPLAGFEWGVLSTLDAAAAFDHGCPKERIRLIRAGPFGGAGGADLDVCGAVRRYKVVAGWSESTSTWLDVTSAYPPSALPPPLPPTAP